MKWSKTGNSRLPQTILVVVLTTLIYHNAYSIPAFARRYEVSCRVCHLSAYPRLNEFGEQFKENGYQFRPGAEEPVKARKDIEVSTPDEKLIVHRELPLSVRFKSHVTVNQNPEVARDQGKNATEFVFPSEGVLVGGGTLHKDISALFSFTFVPEPDLHYIHFGFNNIIKDGWLNARVGKFLMLDYLKPGHRRITIHSNVPYEATMGKNPFYLDAHQAGIDIWGRPEFGPFFYQFALVNGSQEHHGPTDSDDFRDIYSRLSYTFNMRHTFGIMGYYGNAVIEESENGVTSRFNDKFVLAGADAEISLGPVLFFASGFAGQHKDPFNTGQTGSYFAFNTDLTCDFTSRLTGVLLFHQVWSPDDHGVEAIHLIPHLSYMVLRNMKASLEYMVNTHAIENSQVYIAFDTIF
jgi:hypothetical protein